MIFASQKTRYVTKHNVSSFVNLILKKNYAQLQVGENYSYLFNLGPNICKSCCLNTHFISMLAQRLRHWSNIKTALFQHVVFVCTWIRHVMHSFNIYLITTIVLFNTFFTKLNHCYWKRNVCLNNTICKCLVTN